MDFFNIDQKEIYPKISIHIFENSLTVIDNHSDNSRHAISFFDIPALLNIKISSPLIKINDDRIIAIKYSPEKTIYYTHFKPQIRTVHLENPPTSFDFKFKDMLFEITCEENGFQERLKVFTFIPGKDDLYPAPLFNIYEDGRMCFGSVHEKNNKNESIDEFLNRVFFNSIFTHTSYVPPRISEKGSLYKYLFKKRKTGWDFKDLDQCTNFTELGEQYEIS